MMKRILTMLLAAAMLFACAPTAAAQRSLSNPDDAFALPENLGSGLFNRDSRDAGLLLFGNVFEQMLTGKADPQTAMRIMERAPLIKKGDALPPRGDISRNEILGLLFSQGMRGVYVALEETQWPDIYQVIGFYNNKQGEIRWTYVGMGYNAKTGLFHSLNDSGYGTNGLLGLGYEYEAGQQLMRTNAIDSFHRRLGYNIFYDMFSFLLGHILDTLRFPFEYDGKDYQVQIWRGIYGWLSNGGEIGIYEKPAGRPVFWDCSDTELDISMKIYKGGELLFDYGTQRTWWLGGFRLNALFNLAAPKQLGMAGSIAFEDPAMLAAFQASFEKNKTQGITGKADGMVFSFEWQAAR